VLFSGLVALLLVGLTTDRTDAQLLGQAEAAFQEGVGLRGDARKARPAFRKAVGLYEELHRRGVANPDLFRAEGNAYLLADDLPRALLAYRRGLRLAPADRGLRARLQYAREQVAYADSTGFGRTPAENRPPWLPHALPHVRLLVAFCLYTLAWVTLVRWLMSRHSRALWTAGVAFLAAALLTASLAVDGWENRRESEHPPVVIAADGVLLRRGNGLAYPPCSQTPLNRGVEARLLFARGDWLQIELAGGEVGWVPRASALPDAP
jgi:hypothetical protein